MNAEETKRFKAKNLRYRKAIVKDVNLEKIQDDLMDIMSECEDVRWYWETDDDTLINALDGNEDEAYEFKMMFADLCAECEQMQADLQYEYVPQCFDDFFTAITKGEPMLGWDSFEGDYFGLSDSYEESLASKEARKRMSRMTKEQILEGAQACFRFFRSYIGIRHRYDCLKAALDILRDENTGYIKVVKQIEEVYERANADGFYSWKSSMKEYERLIECMPQEVWLQ